jgi:hypothetical protein
MMIRARLRHVLVAAVASLSVTVPGWAFPTPAEHLNDFTHYVRTANIELAAAHAQALIDSGITNAELAQLLDVEGKVTPERFDESIAQALRIQELEPIAGELARRVEAGRLDLARDPKRIADAVTMLTGTQRARLLGRQRLQAASEYAVPALLHEITDGQNQQLKVEASTVIVEIGGPAVNPLCQALLALTGPAQRTVCDLLGRIRHPQAAPYLREVSLNPDADDTVRDAAARAFKNCGGADIGLSQLYSNLSRQYFEGNESLIAFPDEAANNVWSFDPFVGLSPTPVPTPIFSQVMAMKTSVRAVELDPSNADALAIFVAANLKRENDLPEGGADPIYGNLQYTPEFYATVYGTRTCLQVLGMAIDKLDTPLVRDAIAALAKTTGGSNLFATTGRSPLLEAMMYPDRRVQYDAALTLANALPEKTFDGDQAVVPVLASAVRMGAKSLAIVVADDDENRRQTIADLEKLNFQVVGAGPSVAEVQADIARGVGVDLVVIRMLGADAARTALNSFRSIPKTSAAPTLIIAGATDLPSLKLDVRDDPRVHAVRAETAPEAFSVAVESVMLRGAGGRMTDAEAEEYAILALAALRDVAISRCPAYNIVDAESALVDALGSRSGGTRLLVADILAMIGTDRAQGMLFDAALAATDDEQVELLNRVADSVRRFGDKAEKRHIEALSELVAKSTGPLAEAAASVHGALNMPSQAAVELLPKSAK